MSASPADDTGPSHIIVRKRLSIREQLSEGNGCVVLMMIFLLGGIFLGVTMSWAMLTVFSGGLGACGIFLYGLFLPLACVLMLKPLNILLGRDNKQLAKLQEQLGSAQTEDLQADLHRIIDLHNKHRHYGEAEYYSRHLLKSLTEATKGHLAPKAASTDCWVCTPKYKTTFSYYVVWLFESRGRMLLDSEYLNYWSKKVTFSVKLDDILSVELGRHPIWMKPIPLHYVVVTFWAEGQANEIHISPGPHTGTIWEINKEVHLWKEKIESAVADHKKRAKQMAEQSASEAAATQA